MSDVPCGLPNLEAVRNALKSLVHAICKGKLPAIPRHPWSPEGFDRNDPVESAQRWAQELAGIFGLGDEVTAAVIFGQKQQGVAGHVQLGPGPAYSVVVDANLRYNPAAVAAVLGHEMAHILLHRKKLQFLETRQNEILTDCAAIFYGCGVVMAKTYIEVETIYETTTRRYVSKQKLGYITSKEVGYVQAKAGYMVLAGKNGLSGVAPLKAYCANLATGMSEEARKAFKSGQSRSLDEFAARPLPDQSGAHVEFHCPMCVNPNRMRVPAGGKKKVWCPFCGVALVCVAA